MKLPLYSSIILGLAASISQCADVKNLHLDVGTEAFDDLRIRHPMLVSFQTSGQCPTCDVVTTELTAVAKALAKASPVQRPQVVTVDCSSDEWNDRCSSEMDINSWPTIRILDSENGSTRYRGARDAASIYTALTRHLLPKLITIDNPAKLSALLDRDPNVLIISGSDTDMEALTSSILSSYTNHFLIGRVSDSASAESLGTGRGLVCYKQPPSLISPPDDGYKRSTVPWSRLTAKASLVDGEAVTWFLDACAQPAVYLFNRRTVRWLYTLQKPIAYIFHHPTTTTTSSIAHTLHPSANRWREYVSFVSVPIVIPTNNTITTTTTNTNIDLLTALALESTLPLPALSVEGVINSEVYPMPQDWAVEAENVDMFVQGILEGRAKGGREGMRGWLRGAGVRDRLREGTAEEGEEEVEEESERGEESRARERESEVVRDEL